MKISGREAIISLRFNVRGTFVVDMKITTAGFQSSGLSILLRMEMHRIKTSIAAPILPAVITSFHLLQASPMESFGKQYCDCRLRVEGNEVGL